MIRFPRRQQGLTMKTIRIAALSLALVAVVMPAVAPAQFSAGYTFLKDVRDRNGQKVTDAIAKPGSGAIIIDTRDPTTGESALHIVTKGRDVTWLNFLLAKGARPDMRNNSGDTPLMIAAQLGWADGISLLVQKRASVDLANNAGETPLIRAVQNRDANTVRLLLMAGANPAKRDIGSGLSARDYAARDPRGALILRTIDEARPRPKAAVGPN
jgi:uncharacterized protein